MKTSMLLSKAGPSRVRNQIPLNVPIKLKCALKQLQLSVVLVGLVLIQIAMAVPARAQSLFVNTFEYGEFSSGFTNVSNPFPSDPYNHSAKCMRVTGTNLTQFQFSSITPSSGQDLTLSAQVSGEQELYAAIFAVSTGSSTYDGYGFYVNSAGKVRITRYDAMGHWQNPPTVLAVTTNTAVLTTNSWNRLLFKWSTSGALSLSINGTNVLTATDTQYAPGVLASYGLGFWSWNSYPNLFVDNIQLTSLPAVPAAAAALGYSKCLINEYPLATDVVTNLNGNFKWFNGCYYQKQSHAPVTNYWTTSGPQGLLRMCIGSGLYSTPIDMSTGALPVLTGSNGFYVEYTVKSSDNNTTNWQAEWAEAVEHAIGSDVYAGDPTNGTTNYHRWMELDVDEAPYGNSVISWAGFPPSYHDTNRPNQYDHYNKGYSNAIDRTQWHTWASSYDPVRSTVNFYLDGVNTATATNSSPYHTNQVPAVATLQHYWLLVNSQTTTTNNPPYYTMDIGSVRAYTKP